MDFLPQHIEEYAESFSRPENKLLDELFHYTQTSVLKPRMISGKVQGRVLSMLSHLVKPQFILEIGTYTGFSALCLAEGLNDVGELHSIDINDELRAVQEQFIEKSDYAHKIYLHTGDAQHIIPKLNYPWDIVFIDADKENYITYYEMVMPDMMKGGIIIADNVLWSGKVTDEKLRETDKQTKALHTFNKHVQNDPRVENFLLPFRDGLMIARVL